MSWGIERENPSVLFYFYTQLNYPLTVGRIISYPTMLEAILLPVVLHFMPGPSHVAHLNLESRSWNNIEISSQQKLTLDRVHVF